MQSILQKIGGRFIVGSLLIFAAATMAAPQAFAATSGNATIHNAVTVSFTSGVLTVTKTATVDVLVTTLAAAPTIVLDTTTQTVTAGNTATYTYTVRSNANGSDTYTPTLPGSTDTGVTAPTISFVGSPLTLWGGIILGSGAGTINIPAGSELGLTATATTIELLVGGVAQKYTVSTITAGTIASTDGAGVPTAEVVTVLALAPIGVSPAITAVNVVAGTQAGEFDTFSLSVAAGTPTTPGTDGTHVSPAFDVTTTATDAGGIPIVTASSAGSVTTTVSSPSLTITKASRNVTTAGTFATSGTTARPAEVIEYRIIVTNGHATADATSVSISDAIPVYTAVLAAAYGVAADIEITSTVGGVATVTTATTAADVDVDVANVAAGTMTVNLGAAATNLNGGIIAAGDNVVIKYQVTVQ